MRDTLGKVPPSVRPFFLSLTLVYIVVALWALPHSRPLVVLGLSAIFVFTYLVEPIPNPSGGNIFPNNSVKIVAALLWLPQEVIIGVALGSFLGLLLFRRYEMWRAVSNGAGWGLSAGMATLAAHSFVPSPSASIANLVIAAFVAVVTNRITNEGIFAIYKSERFGRPFLVTWLHNILDQWPSQVFAAPIGIVLATIAVRLGSIWGALGLTAISAVALPIPRQELAYYHRAQQMLGEVVEAMVRTLEGIDPTARAHGERVSALGVEVGRRFGLSERQLRALYLASRLHDVGMLAGPEESTADVDHSIIGGRILSRFPDPMIAVIVRARHERWDGTGLPDHLRGKAIPIGGRILAAVEIYESAVAGLPPFESPMAKQLAFSHLISLAGTTLDPKVVTTLLGVVSESETKASGIG